MRDGTDGRHVDGKARKAPARRRARAARRVVVARADARTSSTDLAERCGERPDGPDRRLAVAGPLGPPAEHDHRPVRRKLLSEIPDRLLVEPADAGRPGGVADDAVKTSVEAGLERFEARRAGLEKITVGPARRQKRVHEAERELASGPGKRRDPAPAP